MKKINQSEGAERSEHNEAERQNQALSEAKQVCVKTNASLLEIWIEADL